MVEDEFAAASAARLPRRMMGVADHEDQDYMADLDNVHQGGWDDLPVDQKIFILRPNLWTQPFHAGRYVDETLRLIAELNAENQTLAQEMEELRQSMNEP